MWLKTIWLCLITSRAVAEDTTLTALYGGVQGLNRGVAEDTMLAALYGVQGLNRVLICRARREECAGALLSREWVVARSGCLRAVRGQPLRVLAHSRGDRCEDIVSGMELYMKSLELGVYANNARRVSDRLVHPSLDLGLIRLDRPYLYVDRLANATSVNLIFQQNGIWKWMNRIILEHSARHGKPQAPNYNFKLNSNPYLLCFVSIILPIALFALLFVYVIFCTGTPDTPQYVHHHYVKGTREQ